MPLQAGAPPIDRGHLHGCPLPTARGRNAALLFGVQF